MIKVTLLYFYLTFPSLPFLPFPLFFSLPTHMRVRCTYGCMYIKYETTMILSVQFHYVQFPSVPFPSFPLFLSLPTHMHVRCTYGCMYVKYETTMILSVQFHYVQFPSLPFLPFVPFSSDSHACTMYARVHVCKV